MSLLPGIILTFLLVSLADAKFERPLIRETAYPVPEGAYFVSDTGSDENPGTKEEPFRTIGKAVHAVGAGATLVIRAGTYREQIGRIDQPIIMQAYPRESVWIKGSVVVTDWLPHNSFWRKQDWPVEFDQTTWNPGEITRSHPAAGLPEMVFVDGQPLTQVKNFSKVGSGKFYVDYPSRCIYLGDDPTGKHVEVAAYSHAIELYGGASGSTIRGLGFMHYAAGRHQAAVRLLNRTRNVTLENNTFAWNAGASLLVHDSSSTIVRDNTFIYSGRQGMGSWKTDALTVEGNRFAYNNYERFAMSGDLAGAAGAKLTQGRNTVVRDNLFEDNWATGVWLDGSCRDSTIVRNICRQNQRAGVHHEISAQAKIASNVVLYNTEAGIYISNSSNIHLDNNTIVGNAKNVVVQDDRRTNRNEQEVKEGVTHITDDIYIKNNLLSDAGGSTEVFLWVRDYNSQPLKKADQMIAEADFNGWHTTRQEPRNSLVEWWRKSTRTSFPTLERFRSETGHELHGSVIDGAVGQPCFVDAAGGDFRLAPGSPAKGAGAPLAEEVATAIGVAARTPVDLGALVWPRAERFQMGESSRESR